MQRRNILVIYAAYPTRATLQDGLLAFRRYSQDRVYYLNLRARKFPRYIMKIHWDLIIFPGLFFSARERPERFRRLLEEIAPLADLKSHKVMLPQDEYVHADMINDFITRFGIDTIFSVQPEREWQGIYGPVLQRGVKIHLALTGYLDERRLQRIEAMKRRVPARPIDIGYRTAGRPVAWWGRHGYAKLEIAHVFLERTRETNLKTDISFRAEDTLLGESWYEFLCRCKYQLGVESGTSINDRDGSIKQRTDAYTAAHPDASFEEIEAACFPGIDGHFRGFVISPRHLEAAAAETCQVLVEGEYSGMLQPWEHYVPVKRDWSNLDEVLAIITRDELRAEMVARTYRDIVASGKYTYRSFVDMVLDKTIGRSATADAKPRSSASLPVYGWLNGLGAFDALAARVLSGVVAPVRSRLKR